MSLLARSFYVVCQTRPGHAVMRRLARGLSRLGLLRPDRLPIAALGLEHDAAAGLMRLWRRIHWSGADGMMPPDQLLAIYALAARGGGDGDIVELGCWTGLTTCYLATAARVAGAGRTYAVDTFEGTREGGGDTRPSTSTGAIRCTRSTSASDAPACATA